MNDGEVMAFCRESDATAIDALFGHTVEFVNVEPGGSSDNHQSLKGSYIIALLVFVACHVPYRYVYFYLGDHTKLIIVT